MASQISTSENSVEVRGSLPIARNAARNLRRWPPEDRAIVLDELRELVVRVGTERTVIVSGNQPFEAPSRMCPELLLAALS